MVSGPSVTVRELVVEQRLSVPYVVVIFSPDLYLTLTVGNEAVPIHRPERTERNRCDVVIDVHLAIESVHIARGRHDPRISCTPRAYECHQHQDHHDDSCQHQTTPTSPNEPCRASRISRLCSRRCDARVNCDAPPISNRTGIGRASSARGCCISWCSSPR